MASDHRRRDANPEIFQTVLLPGDYSFAVVRRSGSGTIAPFDLDIDFASAPELTVADLVEARKTAKTVVPGQDVSIDLSGDTLYFRYDPPPGLQALVFTVKQAFWMSKTAFFEDADGNILGRLERPSNRDRMPFRQVTSGSAGPLFVRIKFSSDTQNSAVISARVEEAFKPMADARVLGTFKDWTAVRTEHACVAYSVPTDFRPAARLSDEAPRFIVSVAPRGTGARVDVVKQQFL